MTRWQSSEIVIGWTARDEGFRTAGWADPLGLRREVGSIASELVPVFRRRHTTIDQFGLLCFALTDSGDITQRLLRMARMFAYACVEQRRSWPGVQRAQAWRNDLDVDLDRPLLADELHSGLWASNRGVASTLGLIRLQTATGGATPGAYELTPAGERLSDAFRDNFLTNKTGYAVAGKVTAGRCTKADLGLFQVSSVEGSRAMAKILTKQLMQLPAEYAMAEALHDVWKQNGNLSITSLRQQRRFLTDDQRGALPHAQSLTSALTKVEGPFRKWMTGESVGPSKPLWRDPVWRRLGWSPAAMALHKAGMASSGWESVYAYASLLAQHRDEEFPRRRDVGSGFGSVPREDFRLSAFRSLLAAGLMAL